MRRVGFTLVELAFVLAVIGLLIAMTVPVYQLSVRRAQAAEAHVLLEQIAHAELAFRRDHGAFLACAPSTPEVPRGTRVRFDESAEGWRALGVAAEGPVRYRYRVELAEGSFVAIAEGDLDGDGVTSRFALRGEDLTLSTEDPLE